MPEVRAKGCWGTFLACLACLLSAACSGGGADTRPPAAILSRSIVAEKELRCLMTGGACRDGGAGWARGTVAERLALEPDLLAFRKQHPGDDLSRLADVLLAWIELDKACRLAPCDQEGLRKAAEHARRVRADAGPGTVADVALTIEGAALRRQGRPDKALELLDPLASKLIDPWARALYNPEAVASAVEARRWDRALARMRVWLHEATAEEQASAQSEIKRHLERVPPSALLRLLDGGEEDVAMRKLVAARLVDVAREGKDSRLAQHLLSTSGALLGEQGDTVAQLAAGANRARVEARTVGLLLSLRDERTRRRGADVAEGVAFGLGLPGSAARLMSRDDHGSPERIEEALSALSADGASIIIGGNDQHEADVAAAFAEAHHISVLLLRAPTPDPLHPERRFAFVIGADPSELEATLVAGLVGRGASPVAIVADEPVRPRARRPEVVAVRGCSEAATPWKDVGAAGIVLSAEPGCARAVVASAVPHRLRFAAGFEGEALGLPSGSIVATAGALSRGASPPSFVAWAQGHASPPSWWAALGHDAAVLAWAAVEKLHVQGTEDPGEVEALRAQVAATLAGARAELWTTEAQGFGGGRSLPRTIGVREVSPTLRR
jgi:hypothetical protein